MIVCIDPGLRGCGVALFNSAGELQRAFYVENPASGRGPVAWLGMATAVYWSVHPHLPYPDGAAAFELCLEIPRIYPKSDQQKGDLNDLLELAGVQGAICATFPGSKITPYFPQEWKGQLHKYKMLKRIANSLTDAERNCIVSAGSKTHNVIDAIGIGLHRFGRLNRRVFARETSDQGTGEAWTGRGNPR